jgi:hypothetical protein
VTEPTTAWLQVGSDDQANVYLNAREYQLSFSSHAKIHAKKAPKCVQCDSVTRRAVYCWNGFQMGKSLHVNK